jgi:hypothetical protein
VPSPPTMSTDPSALPTKRFLLVRSIANSPEERLAGAEEPRLIRMIGFAIVFYCFFVLFFGFSGYSESFKVLDYILQHQFQLHL